MFFMKPNRLRLLLGTCSFICRMDITTGSNSVTSMTIQQQSTNESTSDELLTFTQSTMLYSDYTMEMEYTMSSPEEYHYQISEAALQALKRRLEDGTILPNDTFYVDFKFNLSVYIDNDLQDSADEITLRFLHMLVLFGVSVMGILVVAFLLFIIFYKNERMERYYKCKGFDDYDSEIESNLKYNPWQKIANADDVDDFWDIKDIECAGPNRKSSMLGILTGINNLGATHGGLAVQKQEFIAEVTSELSASPVGSVLSKTHDEDQMVLTCRRPSSSGLNVPKVFVSNTTGKTMHNYALLHKIFILLKIEQFFYTPVFFAFI